MAGNGRHAKPRAATRRPATPPHTRTSQSFPAGHRDDTLAPGGSKWFVPRSSASRAAREPLVRAGRRPAINCRAGPGELSAAL